MPSEDQRSAVAALGFEDASLRYRCAGHPLAPEYTSAAERFERYVSGSMDARWIVRELDAARWIVRELDAPRRIVRELERVSAW